MKNIHGNPTLILKCLATGLALGTGFQASASLNLGGAQNFAVFQTGADGGNWNTSDAFVQGDVGIASAPNITLGNLAVNGDVYSAYSQSTFNLSSIKNWTDAPLGQNPTVLSTYANTIHYSDAALAGIATAVDNAENTANGYTADATYANITLNNGQSQTISLSPLTPHMAGTYVIDITGQLNLNGGTLTLNGTGIPAGANVIVNVGGQFSLNGKAAIKLAGGLTASQVLFNNTTTQAASITGGSIMYGSFMGDDLNAQFNNNASAIYGSVIAGSIQFSSDLRVYGAGNEFIPVSPVPEPGTLAAGVAALLVPVSLFSARTLRSNRLSRA